MAHMQSFRTIIESAFYSNHVRPVQDLAVLYNYASQAMGTIVSDLPVYNAASLGLPEHAQVLVENIGSVVGRQAKCRRLVTADDEQYHRLMMEAVYQGEQLPFLSTSVDVGLDHDFRIKAHVMCPETYVYNLYNTALNFLLPARTEHYTQEPEIFMYINPDWRHEDYPEGLVLLDPQNNVGAILGLRYFGEIKKGILSLAWNSAKRHHFIPCHGGLKVINNYTMAVFGLSGSGKSTITLANHGGRFTSEVLHDDAFIISKENGSTIALEPSYFDKTADYPMTSPDVKYFLTVQNVGVTMDNGKKVLITEDIRNGNGRTVKSWYSTQNRVNKVNQPINAIFWIMKDEAFPPLLRINDPILASVMGATLATKRSSAESGVITDQLVIVPYANPFRIYPLAEDYDDFKTLFSQHKVACYVINTGYFQGKKITPDVTLDCIEKVIIEQGEYLPFPFIDDIDYLEISGYRPPFEREDYKNQLLSSLIQKQNFVQQQATDHDPLPQEAADKINACIRKFQ